ncbi:hypothetical protein P7C73_g1957, partial [Tremellales sp. Uapishka_1]
MTEKENTENKTAANDSDDELDEYYRASDADLILISSDGVKFKVHKYHISSASSVLHNAMSIDTTTLDGELPSIQFCDSRIENALSIRFLLDIVYCRPPPVVPEIPLAYYDAAVGFTVKYECTLALQLFQHRLRHAVTENGANPIEVFVLAAKMDDALTCYLAFKHGLMWSWDDEGTDGQWKSNDIKKCIKGATLFDCTAWSTDYFDRMPGEYMLALIRAGRFASGTDWAKAPEEFKELLKHKFHDM